MKAIYGIAILTLVALIAIMVTWSSSSKSITDSQWLEMLTVQQSLRLESRPGATALLQSLLSRHCLHQEFVSLTLGVEECLSVLRPSKSIPREMASLNKRTEELATYLSLTIHGTGRPDSRSALTAGEPSIAHQEAALLDIDDAIWAGAMRSCVGEYLYGGQRFVVVLPAPYSLSSFRSVDDGTRNSAKAAVNDNSTIEARRTAACKERKLSNYTKSYITAAIGALLPIGIVVKDQTEILRAYVMDQTGILVSTRTGDIDAAEKPEVPGGIEFKRFKDASMHTPAPTLANVRGNFGAIDEFAKVPGYTGGYLDVTDLGIVATGFAAVPGAKGFGDVVVAVDVKLPIKIEDVVGSVNSKGLRATLAVIKKGQDSTWETFAKHMGVKLPEGCKGNLPSLQRASVCREQNIGDDRDGSVLVAIPLGSKYEGDPPATVTKWIVAAASGADQSAFIMNTTGAGIAALAMIGVLATAALLRLTTAKEIESFTRTVTDLRLPVVAIDPSGNITFVNPYAKITLGFKESSTFRDYVSEDQRSNYDQFTALKGHHGRSYGIALSLPKDDGSGDRRWVLVRSTTVSWSINPTILGEKQKGLKIEAGSRIGVVIPLGDDDLGLYTTELRKIIHEEDMERVAHLLSHGLKPLVAAYEHSEKLSKPTIDWLRAEIGRSISAIGTLFAGYNAQETEENLARSRIESYLKNILIVTKDASGGSNFRLREKLGWDNGILSNLDSSSYAFTFDLKDWSDDLFLSSRYRGVVEYIFTELITNMLKYGRPGQPGNITASLTKIQTEDRIKFEFTNKIRSGINSKASHRGYKGLELVDRACTMLGGTLYGHTISDNIYSIQIVLPAKKVIT